MVEGILWSFKTKRFAVTLDWQYEPDPDLSWDEDGEVSAKLESGEFVNCLFCVRVKLDGREVAADYLGNSIYSNPEEFVTGHRDPNPENRNTLAMKARNCAIGHYFPDMVKQAISEAREALSEVPHLRRVS